MLEQRCQLPEVKFEEADPVPVEMPDHVHRPPTLQEDIARYVRFQISQTAEAQGFESFEEADDFTDDDEEADWASQYEMTPMQEEEPLPTSSSEDLASGSEADDTNEVQKASEPATDDRSEPASSNETPTA